MKIRSKNRSKKFALIGVSTKPERRKCNSSRQRRDIKTSATAYVSQEKLYLRSLRTILCKRLS